MPLRAPLRLAIPDLVSFANEPGTHDRRTRADIAVVVATHVAHHVELSIQPSRLRPRSHHAPRTGLRDDKNSLTQLNAAPGRRVEARLRVIDDDIWSKSSHVPREIGTFARKSVPAPTTSEDEERSRQRIGPLFLPRRPLANRLVQSLRGSQT